MFVMDVGLDGRVGLLTGRLLPAASSGGFVTTLGKWLEPLVVGVTFLVLSCFCCSAIDRFLPFLVAVAAAFLAAVAFPLFTSTTSDSESSVLSRTMGLAPSPVSLQALI